MLCLQPLGCFSPGCRCRSLSPRSRELREPIPLSRSEGDPDPPSCTVGAVQSPDGSGDRGARALPARTAATSAAAGTGVAGRGAGGGGGARRGGQGGREEPARGLSLGCGMGRQ